MVVGLFSVFRTFTGNPGIPKKLFMLKPRKQKEKSGQKNMSWCDVCKLHKNNLTDMHCDDCNVCIRGYDHHCIFYGKCIGKGNIRWFNLSLATPMLSILVSFAVFGYTSFYLNDIDAVKRPKVL